MGAKIRSGDGWSYTLTETDKLWAGRMAQYEGGSPGDVLWTMTQAYARPAVRSTYPTFTAFIQAYSQPINPAWRRDGRFCAPGGEYAGRDNCAETRLDVRDRAAVRPWADLDADIRAAVSEWFSGSMPNPVPGAVEFAAPGVARSFLDRNGGEVVKQLDNWYIATSESLGWPRGWVSMSGGGLWLAVGLAVLVGGGAAVYLAKRRYGGFRGLSGSIPEHRHKAEELLKQAEREYWKGESQPWACLALFNAFKAESEAEWLPGGGGPGTLKHRARSMIKKAGQVCMPDTYVG